MDPEEVARVCDDLHECIEQGPGENPDVFARALGALLTLRESVSWDYPLGLLMEIEVQLARWFSPRGFSADEQQRCREALLGDISRLEDAWNRPRV
jgi:hypothetical protein